MFTNNVEKFIPPRKGSRHVLRVIREVLYFEAKEEGTNISKAIEYLNKVTTRKAVTFIISDFFEPVQLPDQEPTFKRAITIANKKHDIVAVTLNDPREIVLPNCGLIELEDAETKERVVVDSSNPEIRRDYERNQQERIKNRDLLFRSMGVDHIDVSTDAPYSDALVKFFSQRKRIK